MNSGSVDWAIHDFALHCSDHFTRLLHSFPLPLCCEEQSLTKVKHGWKLIEKESHCVASPFVSSEFWRRLLARRRLAVHCSQHSPSGFFVYFIPSHERSVLLGDSNDHTRCQKRAIWSPEYRIISSSGFSQFPMRFQSVRNFAFTSLISRQPLTIHALIPTSSQT